MVNKGYFNGGLTEYMNILLFHICVWRMFAVH